MPKFRKKPIVVEAIQWVGGDYEYLNKFCGRNWGRADASDVDWTANDDEEQVVLWNTAESRWLLCPVGWFVIRGIKGELYSVKEEIFQMTYEAVVSDGSESDGS